METLVDQKPKPRVRPWLAAIMPCIVMVISICLIVNDIRAAMVTGHVETSSLLGCSSGICLSLVVLVQDRWPWATWPLLVVGGGLGISTLLV